MTPLRPSKHGPLKLLFIGRLSQEKGILQFLNAFSGIRAECHFDIYGTGPLEKDIEVQIHRLRLQGRVRLRGKYSHEEIINLLPEYDALVLPSVGAEFAPLSIIEAALKGLFILTRPFGGMKEMAEEAGNYIFIDDLTSECLEEAFAGISESQFNPVDLSDYSMPVYTENLRKELDRLVGKV